MGQEQSAPATQTYQPDFLTAHVKRASAMLSPEKPQMQGYSSVGVDSLAMANAKKAQTNISGTPESRHNFVGMGSTAGADSFLMAAQLKAQRAISPGPLSQQKHQVGRPHVGGDALLMNKQRAFAKISDSAPRNRFNLAGAPGTPGVAPGTKIHQDATAYELSLIHI